jgi:predicted glutamine amidotransferase
VIDPMNAHPFRNGRWLFAHNGTVLDFERVQPWLVANTDPELGALLMGDTDSEHLFYFLLTRLARVGVHRTGRAPSSTELVARVVRESLAELDEVSASLGARRPLTNVLLTDGRTFVGHRAGMPLHLSTQKRFCADFATCPAVKVCMERVRPEGRPVNHLLLASEPIGEGENLWEELADGTTVALDEGFRLALTPPAHGWTAPELPEPYRIRAAC